MSAVWKWFGSKVFPFRTDLFPEGFWCANRKSQKKTKKKTKKKKTTTMSSLWKREENLPSISGSLKFCQFCKWFLYFLYPNCILHFRKYRVQFFVSCSVSCLDFGRSCKAFLSLRWESWLSLSSSVCIIFNSAGADPAAVRVGAEGWVDMWVRGVEGRSA